MMPADQAQREAALDPTRSFIVQAPAGSGKTELLIQRFLKLLGLVAKPESVVAITFTRKAAGEMRQRVLQALAASSQPRPHKPHEARTWDLAQKVRARDEAQDWNLLENPNRLEIRTIDSLCGSLVARMPWLSRLGPRLTPVENAQELYLEAARETVATLDDRRSSWAIRRLLQHVDNDVPRLEALLTAMLAKRDQWLRHIVGADRDEQRTGLEASLTRAVEEDLRALGRTVPDFLCEEAPPLVRFAAAELAESDPDNPMAACRELSALPSPHLENLPIWEGIAHLLLTTSGSWRKRLTKREGFPAKSGPKEDALSLLQRLQEHPEFRMRLDAARRLPQPRFGREQWLVVEALLEVLLITALQLKLVFSNRGQVDFSEVMAAATEALGEEGRPTDLTLALDERIEHLLVDEFQDTSLAQMQLIKKLTWEWQPDEGRTLFLVGDPMQSIYRFREAEVGLFLKIVREGLDQIPIEPLRLSVNFRSDPGIVEWVNEAFPKIFPAGEDVLTGAVRFNPSTAARPKEVEQAVEVVALLSSSQVLQAERAVEIVATSLHESPGARIAVLARARPHLPAILRAFRKRGLAYRAVEIDKLNEVPLVLDLLSLTCALLHLGDRVSWLSILRAPWCGLLLPDLHALCADAPDAPLWELMQDAGRVQLLSPEGLLRLKRTQTVLEKSLAGRPESLRAWIRWTWLALGGPACLSSQDDPADAHAFFELLDGIDQGGDAEPDQLRKRVEGLFASPDSQGSEELQVMTIHKAKGLEFDVVIVPSLERAAPSDASQLLLWQERPGEADEGGLLMAPIKQTGSDQDRLYGYLRDIENLRSEHETARLLYVAATRAKRKLYLLGGVDPRIGDDRLEVPSPHKKSLLRRLWPSVEEHYRRELEKAGLPSDVRQEAEPSNPPLQLRRLTLDWTQPPPPPALAVASTDLAAIEPEEEWDDISFDWVSESTKQAGTVVHRMLQRIAVEGLVHWDERRLHAERPRYRVALATLGVASADLDQGVDRIESALRQTLKDRRGRWTLDGSHREARSEYPLAGTHGGRIIEARIDRTFVDQQDVRWIIDFKVSSHEGQDTDRFLDNEIERYRGRMEAYRDLFSKMEERRIRMGLYFPLLQAWREYPPAAANPEE